MSRQKSIQELEYQGEVAEWIGADVMNIHGGGAYGDKHKAWETHRQGLLGRIVRTARKLLTVENDDKTYTPADLLPICKAEGLPLVYDVHHHRCNPDGMSVEQATKKALATWDREPMFHISSPIERLGRPEPWAAPRLYRREGLPGVLAAKEDHRRSRSQGEGSSGREAADGVGNGNERGSWFVYLLRCADGSLYTGITNDVPRRLKQHNAGTASRYTRSRLPAVLVYQEAQASRSHALKESWRSRAFHARRKSR